MNKVSRKINVRTHNSVFYKDKRIVGQENIYRVLAKISGTFEKIRLGLMVPYNGDRLGFTLFGCARLPDGRTINTLRKAVFARLRRERRLTRNRRSALLHLQSNENRNFSLLSPVESLNLCANFILVMIF